MSLKAERIMFRTSLLFVSVAVLLIAGLMSLLTSPAIP